MFGIRREQGRLGRAGAGRPHARRRDARSGAWRPGPRRAARRARDGRTTPAASCTGSSRDGLGGLRPSLWLASLVYLDRRRAATWRRRGSRGSLSGAGRVLGRQRHGRPPRRLLRRGGPLPRHDRDGARRVGSRRGALPGCARAQHAGSARGRGSRTPRTSTRACCWPGEATTTARTHGLSSASRSASPRRSGCPRSSRRAAALGPDVEPEATLPDGLSAREVEILVELARGLSNREIGRDAPHQRAHGGEPHPLDPPQDRLRNRTEAAGYAHPPRARPAS